MCHLPEKGRLEIEEKVEELTERDREERGTGMKVKKQNKNIPLKTGETSYFLLSQMVEIGDTFLIRLGNCVQIISTGDT